MADTHPSGITTSELLSASWRLWHQNARTFVLLMGVPILAMLVTTILMFLLIVPAESELTLREMWLSMETWRKVLVSLLMLATFSATYRALAATVFATAEIHRGRRTTAWQAFAQVRRRNLRLFWLILLVGFLTAAAGPVAPVLSLAFGFFCAPAFPAAILENLGVIKALERGSQLGKSGQARLLGIFLLYGVLAFAAAFGFVALIMQLQSLFRIAWYARSVFFLALWCVLLVPQLYMITLTLNYFDQRLRKGELTEAPTPPAPQLSPA